MRLEPLADKWRAFGWSVREVDGHDHRALLEALRSAPFEPGRPSCVIARTHKGHGVSFISDQVGWHHHVPTADEYERAAAELRAELRSGKSLAQVAAAEGKTAASLQAAMLAPVKEALSRAVEHGRLTQSRADEILARITERVATAIQKVPKQR